MMNEASIESYHAIEDITDRQREVYLAIRENGPVTNRELCSIMQLPINCITGRVSELVQKNMVASFGKRHDNVTERNVNEWVATEVVEELS